MIHFSLKKQLEFDQNFKNLIIAVQKNTLLNKIEFFSRKFLETSYLVGALGEGADGYFDQSPFYREDAFDCVTYVNTVIALAKATDLQSFKWHMAQINYYSQEPVYQNRFHMMCLDWNRMNALRGTIKDITEDCVINGRPVTQRSRTFIDKKNWFLQRQLTDLKLSQLLTAEELEIRLNELRECAKGQSAVYSEVPYLPFNVLFKNKQLNLDLFKQLPAVFIIEIVRPNWNLRDQIGTNLTISHLGFAIWHHQQDQYLFRHASSQEGKVVEVPLALYLKYCLTIPTIEGINIQKIV